MLAVTLGIALAAAVAGPLAVPARADGASSEKISVTFTLACGGETVDFTGEMNAVNKITVDADGGFHLVTHSNFHQVRGVGRTSGNEYGGGGTLNFEASITGSNFPLVISIVNPFTVVNKTTGESHPLRLHFHVTFDANGVVRTEFDHAELAC